MPATGPPATAHRLRREKILNVPQSAKYDVVASEDIAVGSHWTRDHASDRWSNDSLNSGNAPLCASGQLQGHRAVLRRFGEG